MKDEWQNKWKNEWHNEWENVRMKGDKDERKEWKNNNAMKTHIIKSLRVQGTN